MWKNLRKGRVFRFWRIIDFFVEILKNCFILALLFYFYYIIMEKIIYTQKIYETPNHVKFCDLANYLSNDAFSLWNDSVKYFEIGERKFFADGKIEEVLFSSPLEKVVRYLRLHEVRAQQNVKLSDIKLCGNILFCDVSFVVMFGNKLPDKAVEKRSFENAAGNRHSVSQIPPSSNGSNGNRQFPGSRRIIQPAAPDSRKRNSHRKQRSCAIYDRCSRVFNCFRRMLSSRSPNKIPVIVSRIPGRSRFGISCSICFRHCCSCARSCKTVSAAPRRYPDSYRSEHPVTVRRIAISKICMNLPP